MARGFAAYRGAWAGRPCHDVVWMSCDVRWGWPAGPGRGSGQGVLQFETRKSLSARLGVEWVEQFGCVVDIDVGPQAHAFGPGASSLLPGNGRDQVEHGGVQGPDAEGDEQGEQDPEETVRDAESAPGGFGSPGGGGHGEGDAEGHQPDDGPAVVLEPAGETDEQPGRVGQLDLEIQEHRRELGHDEQAGDREYEGHGRPEQEIGDPDAP